MLIVKLLVKTIRYIIIGFAVGAGAVLLIYAGLKVQ